MAKTYYLSDDGTKLSLVESNPLVKVNSITVSPGKTSYMLNNGRQAYYINTPGVSGPQHGTYTVTIDVTESFKGAQMQVAAQQPGVFLGTGWTAYKDISLPGKYTFTINDVISADWKTTDTLKVFIQVKNTRTKRSGTVRWNTGTTSSVVAPFSTVVSPSINADFSYVEV